MRDVNSHVSVDARFELSCKVVHMKNPLSSLSGKATSRVSANGPSGRPGRLTPIDGGSWQCKKKAVQPGTAAGGDWL